ncbi:thioredoxin-like protein, partial [Calocera viscosa TUFC12733]
MATTEQVAALDSAAAAPAAEGNPLAPDLATGMVHSEPATAAPSADVGAQATAGATAAAAAAAAATAETAAAGAAPPEPAKEAAKLIVHHLDDSRSQRVLWLLEELELPYEIKYYKRLPSRQAPPELKKVHPLGKSPIITDGAVTIAESGAIVEYLLAKYGKGKFVPTEEGWVDNLY